MTGHSISASATRRLVNGYILDWVSDCMLAGDPDLVRLSNEILIWRVPVYLTRIGVGKVGLVGWVDVNAVTGEIIISPDIVNSIVDTANKLVLFDKPSNKKDNSNASG